MVIDTSALLAVLLGEPERDQFIAVLAAAEDSLISVGTLLEASVVLQGRLDDAGVADLDDLLAAAGVRCVAVDLAQASVARDAYVRFGKGSGPAGLNYGDCSAYALAKLTEQPLLFKGDDFSQTDIVPAMP